MKQKGWKTVETKTTENKEPPENDWALGYFHSTVDWDGKTWARNLHELMIRDLSLFALGDVKNRKILDVGCGSGVYLHTIAKMGALVSGQDISSEYVNNSLKLLRENEFEGDIKVGDATKLLFDDHYFDGVFSADFFEHISYEQKIQVISEVYRVLKPGGIFTIKTPNLDYLKISTFFKRIFSIFKLKSPFGIYIPHTHNNPDNEHHGLTTYSELEEMLFNNMFHDPVVTYVALNRKRLPNSISKYLYGRRRFTEQIIITTRKPLFLGFYP